MLIQTSVGQPTNQGVGATPNIRSGKLGDVVYSPLHAKYYETTYNGNEFFAATTALVTTTVGLAATYTGLSLSNPIGSTVNLVLNKVTFMQSVIQSTQIEAFAIATGFNATTQVTHTTPVTPRTCKVGSGIVPQALADVSSTLPTAPVYTVFIGATSTATADATFGVADLDGSIILTPGAYAAWVTPAQASVAGMWFSFQWEEVPV